MLATIATHLLQNMVVALMLAIGVGIAALRPRAAAVLGRACWIFFLAGFVVALGLVLHPGLEVGALMAAYLIARGLALIPYTLLMKRRSRLTGGRAPPRGRRATRRAPRG